MKLCEPTIPYVIQEVDYAALRQVIREAFEEAFGPDAVRSIRVAHFNPDSIDVTVVARERQPEMVAASVELGETLRRQGLPVAIRVTEADLLHSVVETKISTHPHRGV